MLEDLDDNRIFYCGGESVPPGHTVFLSFQGDGTLLDGTQKSLRSIPDGTVDTILVVQVSPEKAVPWTQPVGIDLSAADLKEALGPPPTHEGYPVVFLNGPIKTLPQTIDEETLRRLIRIDDGQPSGFTAAP